MNTSQTVVLMKEENHDVIENFANGFTLHSFSDHHHAGVWTNLPQPIQQFYSDCKYILTYATKRNLSLWWTLRQFVKSFVEVSYSSYEFAYETRHEVPAW